MQISNYHVYIMSNPFRTVLYTGVTNDLKKRVHQHKNNSKVNFGFAGKYNCVDCIYYETFDFIELAIKREKQIKGWTRAKKLALIKKVNPDLKTLL